MIFYEQMMGNNKLRAECFVLGEFFFFLAYNEEKTWEDYGTPYFL